MGDLSDSDGMIMDEAAVNSAASSRSGGRLHTEKAIGVKIDLVKQADDEKQQNRIMHIYKEYQRIVYTLELVDVK